MRPHVYIRVRKRIRGHNATSGIVRHCFYETGLDWTRLGLDWANQKRLMLIDDGKSTNYLVDNYDVDAMDCSIVEDLPVAPNGD